MASLIWVPTAGLLDAAFLGLIQPNDTSWMSNLPIQDMTRGRGGGLGFGFKLVLGFGLGLELESGLGLG